MARPPAGWSVPEVTTSTKTVQERFRYHYSPTEPQEWVPRSEHLADNAEACRLAITAAQVASRGRIVDLGATAILSRRA